MTRKLNICMGALLLAASALAQTPNLVGYEYWFDQNDTEREYVPVAPGSTVNLVNAQLNTSGLSLGQHVVRLRWKDQPAQGQARWSSVVSRNLSVGQPGPWEVVAVRYWVGAPTTDADPLIRTKYFTAPQTVLSYNGLLDLCGFPTGSQTLKLQLLDNHGQWSSVVTRPVTVNAAGNLGTPSITVSSSTFCPGQVVTFTATPQTGPGFATPTGYNWQIPTGNGWSALPSDSSSILVTIGDASGTVQASATNACGSSQPGSFNVVLPDAPDQVAFILGPLQACIGSDATYSVPALPPGITFIWEITGGWTMSPTTGPSLTTTIGAANATISVIAQNACGVQALPRDETISVTAPPSTPSINGDLEFCSGDSALLSVNAVSGETYSWSTGASINETWVYGAGEVSVQASTGVVCPTTTSTATVEVPQLELGPVIGSSTALINDVYTCQVNGITDADQYDWEPLPTAFAWADSDPYDNAASFMVNGPLGTYQLCVAAVGGSDGCRGDSVCIVITIDGILGGDDRVEVPAGISAWPNPTNGLVYVSIGKPGVQATLRVLDALGRLVMERSPLPNSDVMSFDLSQAGAGAYLIQLLDGDALRQSRVSVEP